MLPPSLYLQFFPFILALFCYLFFHFCLSGWVYLPASPSQSLAVLISLYGCHWFCSSCFLCISLSLFLCMSLSGSLYSSILLLPCYCTFCCHCLSGPHFNTPPSVLLSLPSSLYSFPIVPWSSPSISFFLPYPVLSLPLCYSSKELILGLEILLYTPPPGADCF